MTVTLADSKSEELLEESPPKISTVVQNINVDNPHQVAPTQDLTDDDDQQVHDCLDHANSAKSKPTHSGAIKGKSIPPQCTIKHNAQVKEMLSQPNNFEVV